MTELRSHTKMSLRSPLKVSFLRKWAVNFFEIEANSNINAIIRDYRACIANEFSIKFLYVLF